MRCASKAYKDVRFSAFKELTKECPLLWALSGDEISRLKMGSLLPIWPKTIYDTRIEKTEKENFALVGSLSWQLY